MSDSTESIEEIYSETRTEVSLEEFTERVQEKHDKMGGLVDIESAALLIQQEVEDDTVKNITDISLSDGTIHVIGKITGKYELKTFDRSDDKDDDNSDTKSDDEDQNQEDTQNNDEEDENKSTGKVLNIELTDETDSIKTTFWNKKAIELDENFTVGETVRVEAKPRENYGDLELNASGIEKEENISIDVDVGESKPISELTTKDKSITTKGIILSKSDINTFDRNDGSQGKVGNIILGNGTADIHATLWGDATQLLNEYDINDTIKVENVDVENDEGRKNININSASNITEISEEIEYDPNTAISTVEIGDQVSLHGQITNIEDPNEFDNGESSGVVQNIEIKDAKGDKIRVALWGDKILGPNPNIEEIILINAEIKEGWQDNTEANVGGYKSATYTPPKSEPTINSSIGGQSAETPDSEDSKEETGEPPNESNSSEETTDAKNTDQEPTSSLEEESDEISNQDGREVTHSPDDDIIEISGVVIDKGDTLTIDTPNDKVVVHPPDNDSRNLGESITVRGIQTEDNEIDAHEIF